jgi:hypothetical protein
MFLFRQKEFATGGYSTFTAFGIACLTNIPAMKNKPVMGYGPQMFRYVSDELLLSLQWIFRIRGQPKPG